jgi:hypothetical protein
MSSTSEAEKIDVSGEIPRRLCALNDKLNAGESPGAVDEVAAKGNEITIKDCWLDNTLLGRNFACELR